MTVVTFLGHQKRHARAELVSIRFLLAVSLCMIGRAAAALPAVHSARSVVNAGSGFVVSCDRTDHIGLAGAVVRFTGHLAGIGAAMRGFSASWSVQDFDGKIVASRIVSFPGDMQSAAFQFRPMTPGLYAIRCDLRDSSEHTVVSGDTRIAVFTSDTAVTAPGPILYGIDSHLERFKPGDAALLARMMRLGGLRASRFIVYWNSIQPSHDRFDWSVPDADFRLLAENGITPLPLLGFSAQWATTGNTHSADWKDWANAPPVVSDFAGFAHAAANRYHRYTPYWEIWNEPDLSSWLGSSYQYASLLSSTVDAIHRADPKAQVMNGGVSEVDTFRPGFVSSFLAAGDPKPDIIAYHSHGSLGNLAIATDKIQDTMRRSGVSRLPLWLNESGMWQNSPVTEREQAVTLIKKMAYAPSRGDRAFIVYDLVNDGDDQNDPENTYGLLRHDFTPKAAYVAVHTLANELSGKSYIRNLSLQPHIHAYLYGKAPQWEVVAWTENLAPAHTTLLVKTDAASAAAVDLMGRAKRLPATNGFVAVPIGTEPAFIRLIGGRNAPQPAPRVLQLMEATPDLGSFGTLQVRIRNPFPKRLIGRIEAGPDTAVFPQRSIVIPAGGVIDRKISYGISRGKPGGGLRVRFLSNLFPPIEEEAPAVQAEVVPFVANASSSWNETRPARTLTAAKDLTSLFKATPIKMLQFRDDTDLSARVFVRGTQQGIECRVVVTDDIQSQPETVDFWKGDSVQIALVSPDGHYYEWTGALTGSGPQLSRGICSPALAGDPHPEILSVVRRGTQTTYTFEMPATLPGIARSLKDGCSVDVLVNDNDGAGRKGWEEWTPGIGESKEPSRYAHIVFKR